jgi:PKD repeat protein
MHKRELTQTGVLAVTALTGLGLTVALLLLLGTWTGSALAAPPAADPPALALNPTAGITIVKTAPAIVNQALGAGQTLIPYSLTIQNPSGFAVVAGSIVTDELPAGTTLLGGTTGPDWSGAFPAGDIVVTYTLDVDTSNASIDVGGYQASVPVPVRDGTTFVNTRYCFSGTANSVAQIFCENAPVSTIMRAPDFNLIENTTMPVCAGGRVTYTLDVTNPGGVRTSLPFTITGQITPALNVLPGTISDGGTWTPYIITWNVADTLNANGGNHVTRTFAVTISDVTPHGTLLTNTYTVTSPEVLPTVSFWQSSGAMVSRPTAAFTSSAPACQNNQVAFHNASLGTTSYEWNFGDGAPISTEISPTHVYTSAGPYTVVLTATGACGTAVTTGTVTVFPSPTPILQITPDPTQLGLTTYFTDAAGALGAIQWDWNFGDGNTASTMAPNTSHIYTGIPGTYTVVLTATAFNGCPGVVTSPLQVNPGAPYTVSLDAWPRYPQVATSSAVTASVTDQWGNPVLDGTIIDFTATPPPAVIVPSSDPTSGGLAHATVTSTSAGPVTVRGTAPNAVFGTTVVTFTPGAPYTLTLVVSPLSLPAGSGAALTATVVDVYNNPIPGQVVTFTTSSDLGGGSITPQTDAADALGEAHATVVSTLPGSKTITATASASVWDTAVVTFTSGAPYTVTLVANPLTLTVGSSAALTATIVDQFNNPVPGEVITFSTADNLGAGSIIPQTDTTDATGEATSSIMSTATGPKTVCATASNLISGTVVVTFQAGPPDRITLLANPPTQIVGSSSQLAAQVLDQYSNPVAGEVVTFTYAGDLGVGSVSPITDATISFGWAYSSIDSTLPGPKLVTATTSNLLTATTVITFFAGTPYSLTLEAIPSSLMVGNTATLLATLTDQYANPLPGYTVAFTTSDPLGLGALTPLSSPTDAAGEATSAVSSTLMGVKTVTATQGGLAAVAQVTFTVGAPFTVTLAGAPDTLPVGQNAALTATVTDRFGNPTANDAVQFTASGLGSGGIRPPWDLTDGAGQAFSTISSTVTGPHLIQAQELNNSVTGTTIITWTVGSPASLTLVANPISTTVGGTSHLTATLTDQYSNPLPGYTVFFTTTDPLGLGGLSPLADATDAAGEAASAISSTLTGVKTVTATYNGLIATTPVTFYLGTLMTITVTPDPATVAVGATQAFTATGYDQFNNPTLITPTWTTNGGTIDPGPGATTVYTAPTVPASGLLVTATQGAISGTAVVNVVAGALTTITVTPDPATISVGATQPFTATGQDMYGNPLPVAPTWTTNGGTVDPGPGATTVYTAPIVPASGLLVTATQGAVAGSAVVNVVAGTLTTITVTPNPVTVTVGGTQAFVASGYDQFNNLMPVTPMWTTDGGSVTPGPGATTVFTAQTTPATGRLVTATEGTVSGTAVINIVHGSAVTIELTPAASTIAAGETQPYTVTARDAYANPWDVAALSAYTITPGAGGAWMGNVYNAEFAGTWTVTATYLSLNDTAALTVTHAPTATSAALSPNPHTVGAGGQVIYTLIATDTYNNSWDATASGTYTITLAAGGSWLANVYTSQYTGTWTVTGTVPNAVATAVLTVTELPAASFTRVPTGSVCAAATVWFTDTSGGGPTAWLWDFGDGVITDVQHTTHAYAATGSFTVTLTVTNPYGSDSVTDTVDVISAPSVAITRTPPGNVCVGANVIFTATNTGGPANYLWAFGDGIPATGQYVSHAYAGAATYTVWLTATNGCGTDVVSTPITVDSAPVASFVRSPAGDVSVGTTIQFTDTSSGSPTVWQWDFGDGVITDVQHPIHAYVTSGTFTVTLAVTGTCGSDSVTGTVTVLTGCVGASIIGLTSDSPVDLGQTMYFTATVVGTSPITYTWDFGDATLPVSGVGLVTTSHVYGSSGNFTVTLAVTNACGVDTDILTVTVNCVPLSGLDFTWDPASPTTTETVTFTGTVTGGSPPINYTWNWGDGTPEGTGNPAFHTFTVSGTYTVLMTATNPCGLMTATHGITATGGVFTPTYGVELAPPSAAMTGTPGALMVYALVLTNTGNVADSFDVGVGVAGEQWATAVVPTRTATLAPNGTTPVTVSVQISATATAGQQSIATVTASSVISPAATDSSVLTTTAVVTGCTPPVITNLTSDSPVDLGQAMYFTATVVGTSPITYTWDFGDVTPPVSGVGLITTSHVYGSSGNFTVTLAVTNACGVDTDILTVTVNCVPLSGLDFTWDPASPTTTETVTFTGTVTGGSPPINYTWNWGDGTPEGTGNPAFHTFTVSGTYTVLMTATNPCGLMAATHGITATGGVFTPTYGVELAPPSAAMTGTPGALMVYALVLTNTGNVADSFDVGVAVAGEQWATAVVPTRTATLAPSGTTPVTVSVQISATATAGQQSVATVTASSIISPAAADSSVLTTTATTVCTPPTITGLISNSPVDQGQTMYFTATVTGDTPITYTWDFGDVTPAVSGVGLNSTSHVYVSSGVYTVTLTVTNSCGFDSGILVVTVNALAGVPDHITLIAVPAVLPVTSTSSLTATLYDGLNALLAGQVLTFTSLDPLGGGAVVPLTATTNAQGQAMAIVTSTLTGTKLILATAYNLVSGSTTVVFYGDLNQRVYLPLVMRNYSPPVPPTPTPTITPTPTATPTPTPPPPTLDLVANPSFLLMGDTSLLAATALDSYGAPIAGMAVSFSTSDPLGGGALTPFSTTTDVNGQVTATLRSTLEGIVRVTAQASNGTSDIASVYFHSSDFCAPRLISTATTGPGAREVALDTAGDRAFVAHALGVTVIDTHGFYTIAEINAIASAHGIAYDPDRNRIWVTTREGGAGRVRVLDGNTYAVIADLPAGVLPHSAAYNPANGRVYVSNFGNSWVTVYNAAAMSMERILTNFTAPAHIAVNPVTNKIYVANHGLNAHLTVIDGATHSSHHIGTTLLDAYGVAVDPTRNLIYATSIAQGRLVVINGLTDTQIGRMDIWRSGGRKVPLRVVEVNPNMGSTGHLFLITSSEDGGEDQLLLIPNGWPTLGTPVPLDVASYPQEGIALDQDENRIWVTSVGSGRATVVQDGMPVCSIPFLADWGAEDLFEAEVFTTP